MTKAKFLKALQSLYRTANLADTDSPERVAWGKPAMAGDACCQHIDKIMRDMTACGAFTEADCTSFYDTM